ncbi:flagellar biosynthesis protein FlhF [Sporosarcina gallistercoris]|uniref:Flagellar biosynthesis protein FlhF n=1 Tax=Sporosarcina gallistercoris TaxID=2762245 RepID=A0ABR8PG48_9BACL|nr:flagellar biosynthesis protein FlhF [Sporosarcina gallistercoris]MBD7907113.1 flagellar biosynthesis protein FlhF [Sporosarcina gallistercoris]
MKMKKYTADTMVQAMEKVRQDFGEDSVILSSTIVQSKGFLGLFKKKSVEVVAGYDEPISVKEKTAPIFNEPVKHDADQDSMIHDLKKEMKEMKQLLKTNHTPLEFHQYPEEMQELLKRLSAQELNGVTIQKIASEIFSRMKTEKVDFTADEQKKIAREILKEELADLPFGGVPFKKKYVNVLGPTGVGKTTTIAKIAARSLIEHKRKVAFVTTDTYRIAAIEQLRTYANLLQAPVEVAYNENDFKMALENLSAKDVVFIDTAGRNYKEKKFVDDLKRLIDFELEMESYLVLSTTTKESDMRSIVDQFLEFPIKQFIFTKLDETETIGPVFNLLKDYHMGIAYVTDGQEVPEDLEEATVEKILTLLLEEGGHA